jgi:hypothetical protein
MFKYMIYLINYLTEQKIIYAVDSSYYEVKIKKESKMFNIKNYKELTCLSFLSRRKINAPIYH